MEAPYWIECCQVESLEEDRDPPNQIGTSEEGGTSGYRRWLSGPGRSPYFNAGHRLLVVLFPPDLTGEFAQWIRRLALLR